MGFFSSLMYYRATDRFTVHTSELARFVEAFYALDVSSVSSGSLMLRFGRRISERKWMRVDDHDDWDLEEFSQPLLEVPERLRSIDRPVTNAYLALGGPVDRPEFKTLHRVGSPENEVDFTPDGWSFSLGPVTTGPDFEFLVGSACISLGGNGYLYPWSFADLIERAEQIEGWRRIRELCEAFWPVTASWKSVRRARRVAERREMTGPYWPYPETDRPPGWFWGLSGLTS